MGLAKQIYTCTQSFPKEEMYGIISQMRRASTSIPANIAEGQARNSPREFRQFLGIAQGSAAELETFLILSESLGYIPQQILKELLTNCEEISRLLAALKKSLQI
ncbi:MAG: four helix bundle protein [Candidatus Kapaibacterium sp.]